MSEFELEKGGSHLIVEEHSDSEFYLGFQQRIRPDVNDDDTGHRCVNGMWLTRVEAVGLRDWLSVELARDTP